MSQETAKNLGKLIATFNDRRVISESEVKEVIRAIVAILAEHKKINETLNLETKKQIDGALKFVSADNQKVIKAVMTDLMRSKSEIEKATKEQNDRAFKRLQTLIAAIRMPKDGKDGLPGKDGIGRDGKDGSPDTPEQVRDKLETLKDEERLDASAIKNLPKWIERKGKQMLVGGIRFLENLADVSIITTKKRQDLLIQYDTTNKRWQDGVALTVGPTQPTSPEEFDLWLDTN